MRFQSKNGLLSTGGASELILPPSNLRSRLNERSRARRVIMLVVARGLKRYWLMNRRMCLVSLRPTLPPSATSTRCG